MSCMCCVHSQIPAALATSTATTTQPQPAQVVSTDSGGGGDAGRAGDPQQQAAAAAAAWQWQQQQQAAKDATTATTAPATDILSQAAAVSSIADPATTTEATAQPKEEGDKAESSQAGGQQYPSAHTLYNSYGYNPWSAYPSAEQGANDKPEGVGKPVVSEREKALETEISHLKAALSERTKEVKRLEQELSKAYELIERLHQQQQQQSQGGPGTPQQTLSNPATPQAVMTQLPLAGTPPVESPVTTATGMVTSSSEVGEVSSMLAPASTAAN